jgi:hypothetical protein
LAFLAGWAILRLLAVVPILGGLIGVAAAVFGLDALIIANWRVRTTICPPAPAEQGMAAERGSAASRISSRPLALLRLQLKLPIPPAAEAFVDVETRLWG